MPGGQCRPVCCRWARSFAMSNSKLGTRNEEAAKDQHWSKHGWQIWLNTECSGRCTGDSHPASQSQGRAAPHQQIHPEKPDKGTQRWVDSQVYHWLDASLWIKQPQLSAFPRSDEMEFKIRPNTTEIQPSEEMQTIKHHPQAAPSWSHSHNDSPGSLHVLFILLVATVPLLTAHVRCPLQMLEAITRMCVPTQPQCTSRRLALGV